MGYAIYYRTHYSMHVGREGESMMDEHTSELAGDEASCQCDEQPGKDLRQRHREVIMLLNDQVPIREIAAITGYCPRAVSYIAQRYRESGMAALEDRRQRRAGAPRLLTAEQQQELAQALWEAPPDGATWTGPMVAEWIAARIGQRVHRQRGWEYLRRLKST
jgi:transposase